MLIYNICIYADRSLFYFFFFQAEDGIRDYKVTGVQTWLFRSRLTVIAPRWRWCPCPGHPPSPLEQASPTAPPPLQRQYSQDDQKQGEGLAQPEPCLFEHFITWCPTKKFADTGHGGTGRIV